MSTCTNHMHTEIFVHKSEHANRFIYTFKIIVILVKLNTHLEILEHIHKSEYACTDRDIFSQLSTHIAAYLAPYSHLYFLTPYQLDARPIFGMSSLGWPDQAGC